MRKGTTGNSKILVYCIMRNLIYILLWVPIMVSGQSNDRGADMLALSQRQALCHAPGNIVPTGQVTSDCNNNGSSFSGWNNNNATRYADYVEGFGWVMRVETTNASSTSPRVERTLTKADATTYDVSFWYRVTVGDSRYKGALSWTGWTNWTDLPFNSDGEWHYAESLGLVSNSTSTIVRFYPNSGYTALGNAIQIWNLKIVPQ